ncbi:MAG: glycosyltransferase family 4 protein [Patescibacteria group bacterium]
MKKVAIITYQAFTRGQGGGTRYAATVADWAKRAGYRVTLLTRSPDAADHRGEANGIKIIELGSYHLNDWPHGRLLDKDIMFARALRVYLRATDDNYDIIHTIIPDLIRFIPAGLRRRVIVSVIEDFWTRKVSLWHQLFSYYQRRQASIAVRTAAVVTLPSATALKFFQRHYIGATDKCRLIYDFVDQQTFYPSADVKAVKQSIFLPQRSVPQKMVGTAIRALHRLSGELPELKLIIAGGGPQDAKMKQLADRLGLAARISFLGAVPFTGMPNMYHQAGLVVITSAAEGAQPSPTAAEAMACARPLIMTDVCDTDGVFKDIVPVFSPGDEEKLAELISEVLKNYGQAGQRAQAARQIILKRFSLETFLNNLADIYRNIQG